MEKISETEFKKIVSQPDIEVIKSLDQLYAEKTQYEDGIKNNQTMLDAVLLEISEAEGLGLKTQAEIALEITPVEVTPEIIN